MQLDSLYQTHLQGQPLVWDTERLATHLQELGLAEHRRATDRWVEKNQFLPSSLDITSIADEFGRNLKPQIRDHLLAQAKKRRHSVLAVQLFSNTNGQQGLFANDARLGRCWIWLNTSTEHPLSCANLVQALNALTFYKGKDALYLPHGHCTTIARELQRNQPQKRLHTSCGQGTLGLAAYSSTLFINKEAKAKAPVFDGYSRLDRLEAESIHIMREVMASASNPVMLYSAGKDSTVMLHLARKAFYPSSPPFPLLHIDTRWKFQEMYQFRDYISQQTGIELLVHTNPDGIERNINPLAHGSALHTDIMKTEGLKQALEKHSFDVAFGGARREEEKSRAKERIFSYRNANHQWDPKNQRPELWNLYNGHKKSDESIRVFPISNWTELDIWHYIYREKIPIVPLYFAAPRPVIERDGMIIMIDDERLKLMPNESVAIKTIRFRTLGCYPLTGAIESQAQNLEEIILELLKARNSERQGRVIDSDITGSMEKKKREGYF